MNGLELLPLILLGFLLFYLIFPIWSYMRLSQMLREEREENRRVQTLILKRLRSLQAKMEQKTGSSESLADAEPEARTTVSSASYAEKKGRAGIHHSTEEFASLSFPDEESCGAEQIVETLEKLSVESSSVKSSSVETPSGESSAESPVETIISPATEHSKKTEFPENGAPAGKETIDSRTSEAWNRIVEWFCVGENYRYKNISREYAFATTWLIRIAVVILIAGVVFFLKFAVQNNLISPEVRIGCAFLAGCAMAIAGMIGAKRKYHIAAVGIMGAGFVTMYLSARAGYIVYSMTDSLTVFLIMTVITIAAMASSIRADHPFPAFLGITGGYLTPIMLSTGSRNYIGFFIYLSIITFGLLILANFRKWRGVNLFGFLLFAFLTVLTLTTGIHQHAITEENCRTLLWILGLNYAFFAVVPLCRPWRETQPEEVTGIEIAGQILNHLLFTISGLAVFGSVLHKPACEIPQAVLLLASAAFQAGVILFCLLREPRRKEVIPAAMLLSIYSIGMVVPILLSGEWIPAAWSLLAMMLLLLSSAIQSDFLRKIVCFGFLIVFLRILLWDGVNFSPSAESFRESFLSGGVFTLSLIVSWIALVLQAKRWPEEKEKLQVQRTLFGLAGGIAFFLYTSLELYKLLRLILPDFTRGGVSLWWGILAVGFLFAGILGRWKISRIFGLVVFGLCSLKVFFYDLAGYHLLAKSIGLLVLSVVMIAGALLYIRFRDRFDKKDGEV